MKTRINAVRISLQESIETDSDILQTQIYRYIRTFDDAQSSIQKYTHQSDSQVAFYRDFAKTGTQSDLSIFHKLVLLDLIEQFPARVKGIRIPDSINAMFQIEFERILNAIEHDAHRQTGTGVLRSIVGCG